MQSFFKRNYAPAYLGMGYGTNCFHAYTSCVCGSVSACCADAALTL